MILIDANRDSELLSLQTFHSTLRQELRYRCQPGVNCVVSAIKPRTSGGFSCQNILMGLAAYGCIGHASATTLVHWKHHRDIPQISHWFDHYLSQAFKHKNTYSKPSRGLSWLQF
ncbi:uncharacterized protein VP01_4873g1 [Puccinia sorghi]|uniref:Uncharacterized protein n=1 Tax=Puccinia sorghi TaxID=27349 RepID=A0A0L6UP81_9BASI|nr:uncharacterized protein VP01_4873g1 [Puccinia sorghi]